MSSDDHNEQRLWIRFVSGDTLTPKEGERLVDWVDDTELRDVFLDDLQTDRALRSSEALAPTEEHFIVRTLERLQRESGEDEFTPAASLKSGGSGRPLRRLAGLSLVAAALAFSVGVQFGGKSKPSGLQPNDEPFVWATPDDGNLAPSRLGTGLVELPAGDTVLAFDSGATLDVAGPATLELVGDDEVVLLSGQAEASVPTGVAGFVVRTPTVRVVESDVTFNITVRDQGATDVRLVMGELSVEAGRSGRWSGHRQRLSPEALLEAHVVALFPGNELAPIVLEAVGDGGIYAGMILANGEALEFGGREALERARTAVSDLYLEAPEHFSASWSQLAPSGGTTMILIEGRAPERFKVDELHTFGQALSLRFMADMGSDEDGVLRTNETTQTFEVQMGEIPPNFLRGGAQFQFIEGIRGDIATGQFMAGVIVLGGERYTFESPDELQILIDGHTEALSSLFMSNEDWSMGPEGERQLMIKLGTTGEE
ncbi:MAG: hypothetical protein ACI9K5_002539 [Gammaproteobacteria bacterium]|jgi:hypothetical protein